MTDTRSDARFILDATLDLAAGLTLLAVVGVGLGVWYTTTHCAVVRDQWRKRVHKRGE